MSDTNDGKELTLASTVEPLHTAARLQELEAEATTPWVKQYIRSLIEEHECIAREHETSLAIGGARA